MKPSRFYAQVLCDVTNGANGMPTTADVVRELSYIVSMMEASPLLARVFSDPTLTDREKLSVLAEIKTKAGISPFVEKFSTILIRRNRMALLEEIILEVEVVQIERAGGLVGELSTPQPLPKETLDAVTNALSKKLNKKIALRQKVRPTLIAGLRVTIGGFTYDGSVQAQLNRIQESFK